MHVVIVVPQPPHPDTVEYHGRSRVPRHQYRHRPGLEAGKRPGLSARSRRASEREGALALGGVRHAEVADPDAALQTGPRLLPPLPQQAVAPAERRVPVDAQDRGRAANRESTIDTPEEPAPEIGPLQVVERRASEGAKSASAVAAPVSLPPREYPPLLHAPGIAVRAGGAVLQASPVVRGERKAEVPDRCDEVRVERPDSHARDSAASAGAEP